MIRHRFRFLAWLCGALLAGANTRAQVVNVTMGLDSNQIGVGGTTKLHVYAQIIPSLVTNTDRIFSWYVDLLDSNGAIGTNNFNLLSKPTSDNDPTTSSPGTADGVNLRAIYDTFINLPDAGRTNRVELFNVPVTGVSTGKVTFRVQAGTTANIGADFIVAPQGGGDPLIGGDYSAASVDLNVGGGGLRVNIARPAPGQVTIAFPVVAGQDYYVESIDTLAGGSTWQALPNGPHNSGSVTDTNSGPQRFYRVRVGGGGGGLRVNIARPAPGQVTIAFPVVAGQNYYVESIGSLTGGSTWQALPNGPHNSGSVTDTNLLTHNFYRVRIGP